MDSVSVKAIDYVREGGSVVESAHAIGQEVARLLKGGACVVLSLKGVRGASSSFFNVVLSHVAEALHSDFSEGRFDVDVDTPTQKAVFGRSLAAIAIRGPKC